MSRRVAENIVAGVLALAFAAAIVLTLDYGARARMVPLPVAAGGLVLTLLLLVWQNLGRRADLEIDLLRAITRKQADEIGRLAVPTGDKPRRLTGWRAEALAFGIVGAMLALVLAIGPLPAVAVFTAGYFLASGHYRWHAALAWTGVFVAALWLTFALALEIPMHYGLLEETIARLR